MRNFNQLFKLLRSYAPSFSNSKNNGKSMACVNIYYIGPMGFRSIIFYLSSTLPFAYIKVALCTVLLTKYNTFSLSFFFLSFTLNMVSEPLSCGPHWAISGIAPLLHVHGDSTTVTNCIAATTLLGIPHLQASIQVTTLPKHRSCLDLLIAIRINRIRLR